MVERKTLVVGSGAGGLTLALLLARAGRSVTLIESQPEIGGYLRRFSRDGVRFDTGYHFSGGYTNVMPQMLHVLGMDDAGCAEAIPNRIILKQSGDDLTVAAGGGYRGTEDAFAGHFAGDAAALHRLFDSIRDIWRDTPMRDLADLTPPALDITR